MWDSYWTQFIAKTAKHITAIDYSNEVLNIANQKDILPSKVNFLQGDAYQLDKILGTLKDVLQTFGFHIYQSLESKIFKSIT